MAIGQPVGMIDGLERVSGTIDYAINVELPGTLVGRLVTSPYAHARILSIDVSAARRVPGVRAVVTAADLIGLGIRPNTGRRQRPVLASDRVRYGGEPDAATAARDA